MALKASEAKALADKTIASKLECRKQRFGAWVREQAAGRGLGASQICEATQGVVFPRAFVGEQGLPPTLQNAVAQEPRKWEELWGSKGPLTPPEFGEAPRPYPVSPLHKFVMQVFLLCSNGDWKNHLHRCGIPKMDCAAY